MPGETKGQFMSRVRKALINRGKAIDLPADVEVARVIRPDEDVTQIFATRAEEAKMIVHRVANEQKMISKIIKLLEQENAKTVVVPTEDTLPACEQIIEKIKAKGITLLYNDDPDTSFTADVGVTGATAAIAETASICVTSGNGHRRLASLAVPCHIVVVRADQIVPDLVDWTSNLPADRPASEVLISAPSKTSDIELILVMGVHGPNTVHVIILA